MNAIITPHQLAGSVIAPSSKSIAHRALILAALADRPTNVDCTPASDDIDATIRCLRALGCTITQTRAGYRVVPLSMASDARMGDHLELDVGESGSTLRFLLPVICACGRPATLTGHGRLARRPLSPLFEELVEHGCALSVPGTFPLEVRGTLVGGTFRLPGNVSSQYVSALLMAAPLLGEEVDVLVSEPIESEPYITLTVNELACFGVVVDISRTTDRSAPCRRYHVAADAHLTSPGTRAVEGDWSNAAFWLAGGALSPTGVEVTGLDPSSTQGDRAILAALALFGSSVTRRRERVGATLDRLRGITIDLADTPDLVAPLVAVAAHACGMTTLTGATRLALKESDRLATMSAAVRALGARAGVTTDTLTIEGRPLAGGTVDAAGDHRVAMMASVAAAYATGPTTILSAECVSKSYPTFFEDFASLGGRVSLEA